MKLEKNDLRYMLNINDYFLEEVGRIIQGCKTFIISSFKKLFKVWFRGEKDTATVIIEYREPLNFLWNKDTNKYIRCLSRFPKAFVFDWVKF